MVIDIYNDFKSQPGYNKLVGNDYLIIEYKCPIEIEKFQLLTEMHLITFVISGRKDWITPDKTFEVQEGDALFLRKGVYTTRQYLDVDHCVLLFFMNDNFIRNFMHENDFLSISSSGGIVNDQLFELDVDDAMKTLFYSVFNYLKMGTAIPRNLVEIKFKELLFTILLNPKNKKVTQFFDSVSKSSMTNLDQVMMKNFQHDLSLEQFARLCGRSLSAFKRDFKKIYQQTPGKWLTERRLEYARVLLMGSDLNVNEVCYESGFRNSSHFNKAFKEKYQLPPKQFRLMKKMPDKVMDKQL